MSSQDWQWKIGEAVERVRTRYEFIGRKTGAPFLAVVYPPEAETAFLKEWHAQRGSRPFCARGASFGKSIVSHWPVSSQLRGCEL